MGSAEKEGLDKAFGPPSRGTNSPQFAQDSLSSSNENSHIPGNSSVLSKLGQLVSCLQGPLPLLIYYRLPCQPGWLALWTLGCQPLHGIWEQRDLGAGEGPQASAGEV